MLVGNDEQRFRRDLITRAERSGDSLRNGAMAGDLAKDYLAKHARKFTRSAVRRRADSQR